jgi:hypothetical protein
MRSLSSAISVLSADATSLFAAPMAKVRNKAANSARTIRGRAFFFTVLGIRLTLVMLILLFHCSFSVRNSNHLIVAKKCSYFSFMEGSIPVFVFSGSSTWETETES